MGRIARLLTTVLSGGISGAAPLVSGYALNLDISALATLFQDTAATTPVTADADPIGSVNDGSANAYNVTQASATVRPTYKAAIQNALSIARFDGGDRLAFAGTGLGLIRNISYAAFFLVAKCGQTTAQTDADIIGINSGSGNARLIIRANLTANRFTVGGRRLDADSFQSITSNTNHNGAFVVLSAIFDYANSNLTLRQNGVQVAESTSFQTDGSVSNTAPTTAWVGSLGSTFYWDGDLGQVVAYTSAGHAALTLAEIQQNENSLAEKWNINF